MSVLDSLSHQMVLHNYINMVHIYMTFLKESEAATARREAILITVKHSQLTYKPSNDV